MGLGLICFGVIPLFLARYDLAKVRQYQRDFSVAQDFFEVFCDFLFNDYRFISGGAFQSAARCRSRTVPGSRTDRAAGHNPVGVGAVSRREPRGWRGSRNVVAVPARL
jgi:hypothetical protein